MRCPILRLPHGATLHLLLVVVTLLLRFTVGSVYVAFDSVAGLITFTPLPRVVDCPATRFPLDVVTLHVTLRLIGRIPFTVGLTVYLPTHRYTTLVTVGYVADCGTDTPRLLSLRTGSPLLISGFPPDVGSFTPHTGLFAPSRLRFPRLVVFTLDAAGYIGWLRYGRVCGSHYRTFPVTLPHVAVTPLYRYSPWLPLIRLPVMLTLLRWRFTLLIYVAVMRCPTLPAFTLAVDLYLFPRFCCTFRLIYLRC